MDLEVAALVCSSAANYSSPQTGAIVPSIHPSTTFSRDGSYNAHTLNNGEHPLIYSRADNPTASHVEHVLSKLDDAEESCVFSSGMAAVSAIMNACFVPDCVVFFPRRSYFINRKHFREWCTRMRVRIVQYDTDASSLEYLKLAIEMVSCEEEKEHEKFMWIETPANSSWEVLDIETVTGWCRKNGVTSFVDATVLTPLLCQPLKLGADFVIHSCSKYLNGHSDVLAGAARVTGGAVLSAFDCFLLLRGIRTLHLRVPKASENGMHVAMSMVQFKFKGEKGEKVAPSLPGHENHAISKQQQAGKNKKMFGGMLSVVITPILPDPTAKTELEKAAMNNNEQPASTRGTGNQEDVKTTTTTTTEGGANLPSTTEQYAIKMHEIAFEMAKTTATLTKIWRPATSLGGPESLIEHRASVEGGSYPWSQCPAGLLRLSCGLEPGHRLARDLKSALHAAHLKVCGARGLLKISHVSKVSKPIEANRPSKPAQQPAQPIVDRNLLHGILGNLTALNDKKRPHPDNAAEEARKKAPEPVGDLTLEIPVGSLEEPNLVAIRKPRKPSSKVSAPPAPDEQRCCKKSSQWHCPKFRFGATRYCERHQDCVLRDMEGPKKKGRKPGSATKTAANAEGFVTMTANGVPMPPMATAAFLHKPVFPQEQTTVATPMHVDRDPLTMTTTTTPVAPRTTDGQSEQAPQAGNPAAPAPATAPLATTTTTVPTSTTQAPDPPPQNAPSNVPQPSPPKNDGIFTSGDLDMPISMMVTDSGKVNLQLALDAQTRMDNKF
ncbi:unnamed protein product [Bathycoccus prasinos]